MTRTGMLFAAFVLALTELSGLGSAQQRGAQSNTISLAGTIKSAAGEKMEGVTVSARADNKTFTTSVFTDKDGDYVFPPLDAGSYKVLAQARGYEAGRAQLAVTGSAGSARRQDFVLKVTKDVARQMTGDQWIASMPEQTDEDRRMKAVFRTLCVDCHTPSFPLQNRFDEKGWEKIITVMSLGGGNIPKDTSSLIPNPQINYYKKRLAAYLAKVRGPETMTPKLRPRPSGDATLAVITEYDVPLHEKYPQEFTGSDWSLGTPSRRFASAPHAHDAIEDLSGNLWFTENGDNGIRSIGKVDAKTGQLTNFKTPGTNSPQARTHGITRDQKGDIWATAFTRPGSLVRIDPKTDKFEVFTPTAGPGVYAFTRADGQGRIWANEDSGILMLDPETKKFTSYKSPYDKFSPDGAVKGYGSTGDSQGNGWWSQINLDIVNKANSDTGKVESIKLPMKTEISALFTGDDRKVFELGGTRIPAGLGPPWRQGPRRPAADLKSDYVWFPFFWGNAVASINVKTNAMKQYPLPVNDGGPYELVVDDNHNVWAALQNADAVVKLDPATGKWIMYDLPTVGAEARNVSAVTIGNKTEVNVSYTRGSKIVRLQFRTKEEAQQLKNQAKTVAQNR